MLNKVSLIGNLGQDIEIKGEVGKLSVATSESWKDKASGGRKERTEWHRVTVFGDNFVKAITKVATKGRLVYIEGKLRTSSYEKDGVTHFSTEVVVDMEGTFRVLDKIDSAKDKAA
jgi:single-strand DNA-binding protein